jgi:hypothetical protein
MMESMDFFILKVFKTFCLPIGFIKIIFKHHELIIIVFRLVNNS